ncbi:hypothetical protein LSAT2_019739 [Lamellibrachia satsuma]|nr:hypothetical protein LSAT2_019739 [Lamellibrachia satsuma]
MRADTVGHVTKPLTSLPAIACRDTQVLCARSILMNAKATRATAHCAFNETAVCLEHSKKPKYSGRDDFYLGQPYRCEWMVHCFSGHGVSTKCVPPLLFNPDYASESDSPEDAPWRVTPGRMYRREQLIGGCTVESDSRENVPYRVTPWRIAHETCIRSTLPFADDVAFCQRRCRQLTTLLSADDNARSADDIAFCSRSCLLPTTLPSADEVAFCRRRCLLPMTLISAGDVAFSAVSSVDDVAFCRRRRRQPTTLKWSVLLESDKKPKYGLATIVAHAELLRLFMIRTVPLLSYQPTIRRRS